MRLSFYTGLVAFAFTASQQYSVQAISLESNEEQQIMNMAQTGAEMQDMAGKISKMLNPWSFAQNDSQETKKSKSKSTSAAAPTTSKSKKSSTKTTTPKPAAAKKSSKSTKAAKPAATAETSSKTTVAAKPAKTSSKTAAKEATKTAKEATKKVEAPAPVPATPAPAAALDPIQLKALVDAEVEKKITVMKKADADRVVQAKKNELAKEKAA